ncbi:MAG: hypothetical protein RIQ54_195, partial [Candidatus Parcubacteria bacterium]
VKVISKEQAEAAMVIAIESKDNELAVAVVDAQNEKTKAVLTELADRHIRTKIFIASRAGIEEAMHFYEYIPAQAGVITGKLTLKNDEHDSIGKKIATFQSAKKYFEGLDFGKVSTTQLFDECVIGALSNHASDIHFETEEQHGRIRYRIDGLLHDVCTVIPPGSYRNLMSRIKLLSGLKINVRDHSQDGRFTIHMDTKDIEVRVSIIPGQFGETVVMRILDPDSLVIDLTKLGMRSDDLEMIKKDLDRPNGLILNTGPTGSGKTTTLYAFLQNVASSQNKVITVEDPIEYRIPNISQTQVDPEAQYTFASGLRSILRQDPDVILVGEIRDEETADMAMQASLTGHLVFSTLHTNDAIGAIPRLIDLGVRSATIGPAVAVVIAQRLVRRLCPVCKQAVSIDDLAKKNIETLLLHLPERIDKTPYQNFLNQQSPVPQVIYKPIGCDQCSGFGYKGRIAIFEFFRMSPELEEAILQSASEVTVRAIAKQQKMVTMQQDGILKVLTGETSFEEVEEVTGRIEWSRFGAE